jgi:TonB-dependent starch-binding outer membrane protein SusC
MGFSSDLFVGRFSLTAVMDWQQGGSVINLTKYLQDAAQTTADWGEPSWEERYQRNFLRWLHRPVHRGRHLRQAARGGRELRALPELVEAFRLGARSVRVGITGRNLLMFTEYSGLDPEVSNFGSLAIRGNLDIAPHPPTRSFFFNLAVGF